MSMIQRRFYLPADVYQRLQLLSRREKQNITQVLRELVVEGLTRRLERSKPNSAQALTTIARRAEEEGWVGPRDLATEHNRYFAEGWGSGEQE